MSLMFPFIISGNVVNRLTEINVLYHFCPQGELWSICVIGAQYVNNLIKRYVLYVYRLDFYV